MQIIERPFFNLAVIDAPLQQLLASFSALPKFELAPVVTALVFPMQPYRATETDPPPLLWSPSCAPHLTAFMPRVSSGDYFVVSYASNSFGLSAIEARSTNQDSEWAINELIVYHSKKRQRVVRAMRDDPRWDFYTDGAVLPFEDTAAYSARRIRDRFTRSMLLAYVERRGAPLCNPLFWQSEVPSITLASRSVSNAAQLQGDD